jgi:transposase
MKMEDLFGAALGLQSPWFVELVEFKENENGRELHIHLNHEKHHKFKYDDDYYSVYDHQQRTWRHLNFFEHECYLYARVPRVKTNTGQVLLIDIPWAQPGSSFTLLFEAYAALLVKGGMPMSTAGDYLDIDGRRIWKVINRMVSKALTSQPLDPISHLGVDETSSKKGHQYITVFTDVEKKKVVGVAEGKDIEAFNNALIDMESRGADRDHVSVITMDMSPSFIAGATQNMPDAELVFDRFHLEQSMNKAVDQVRREEAKDYKDLKKTRYLWLKNQSNLSELQNQKINDLATSYPRLGKAYRLKEQFKEVLNEAYYSSKITPINKWLKIAWDSEIVPIRNFVNTLVRHWYGIKTYFQYCVSNGFSERVNLKIQEIKRIAKGYANTNNFLLMIYFHLGRLDLNLPTKKC